MSTGFILISTELRLLYFQDVILHNRHQNTKDRYLARAQKKHIDTCGQERTCRCVSPSIVTSTTFVTAHQLCQFIATVFVNLITFVNSELTSFVNNINHLCRYRRGHYFCQQGPTTFVNRNCIAYLRVLGSVTIWSNQLILVVCFNILCRIFYNKKNIQQKGLKSSLHKSK